MERVVDIDKHALDGMRSAYRTSTLKCDSAMALLEP